MTINELAELILNMTPQDSTILDFSVETTDFSFEYDRKEQPE